MNKDNISKLDLFYYSFPAIFTSFAGIPLYVYAPEYYNSNYSVSLSYLGLSLLVLRAIDAVQDPLIGLLSDKYSRYRYYIILIASIILVMSFFALFQPNISVAKSWFFVTMLAATSAYSVVTINLNAYGGLWTQDKRQQLKVTTFRESFSLIGLLVAVSTPSILMSKMSSNDTFLIMSIVLFIFMCFAMICLRIWCTRNPSYGNTKLYKVDTSLIRRLSNETHYFFKIYFVSMLASSIPSVLVIFFIKYRLNATNYTGLFLFLYFISGAIGMIFWYYLSNKLGKERTWAFSMLIATTSFVWVFFLQEGDIVQYAIICVTSGVAFSADLAIPPSILADQMHKQKLEQNATLLFGVLAFLAKLSLGISSAIVMLFLDKAGFQSSNNNENDTLLLLSFLYSILPCAIKLVSYAMINQTIRINKET
jgi:GPH family glycoside/pentoside/hexuronide:cation symporter